MKYSWINPNFIDAIPTKTNIALNYCGAMGKCCVFLLRVAIVASLFCSVQSSEEEAVNAKSLLSSKLQTLVRKLSKIIKRLDSTSGVIQLPESDVKSAAKTRPAGTKIKLIRAKHATSI